MTHSSVSQPPDLHGVRHGPTDRWLLEETLVVSGAWYHVLLNSNDAPEVSDLAFIRSVISQTDERLTRLEDEKSKLEKQLRQSEDLLSESSDGCQILLPDKSQLQEMLGQLEEGRVLLSRYRMRNTAILSPLRRIPPELLDEIFWWTIESSRRSALNYGKFDMNIPWVLTWVSSRWRAVALASPSLWSLVVLDYSSKTQNTLSPSLFPFVEAQIQRAQKLSIHFFGCHEIDSGPQIQMFELLSRHASRWVELSVGITAGMVPLIAALRDRLMSLRRLWMQWEGPESQIGESIDCFRGASSLVDVSVFNEYRFMPTPHPTHRLTRYQLDATWETHKAILKLAPNLIEARIEINTTFNQSEFPSAADSEEILRLALRRLYLSDPDFLGSFRLPLLEGLALRVGNNDNPTILRHLESFLGRSACPLRNLCLRGSPNAHATTEILRRFPLITELAIMIDDSEAQEQVNVLVAALIVSEMGLAVAPQLRCLRFGCEDETFIDYATYLQMLQSRWKSEECALTTAALLIDLGPRPKRATRRGLHALRLEGLDFVLAKGPNGRNDMHVWAYAPTWN